MVGRLSLGVLIAVAFVGTVVLVVSSTYPGVGSRIEPIAPTTTTSVSSETPQLVAARPVQPAAGPTEGLKVHGFWTVEIVNADGTVSDRRAFENALAPSGTTFLLNLLGGSGFVASPGSLEWSLEVDATAQGAAGPCAGATSSACRFSAPRVTSAPTGTLRYSGSATATSAGTIDTVRSFIPGLTASCCSVNLNHLTTATVSPAIAIAQGQQVRATVDITTNVGALTSLLSGAFLKPGNQSKWTVEVLDVGGAGPCGGTPCRFTATRSCAGGQQCFFSPVGPIELAGSGNATAAGTITTVRTFIEVTTSIGGTPFIQLFTTTTLATPVSVVAGQAIQVAVNLDVQ